MDLWDDIPLPGLGADLTARAAQSKRPADPDTAPAQQPMKAGLKPAQTKAPSADQKKTRRQMARNAHVEEPTMSTTPTEADLVARLAAATTLAEQADLSAQIEAVRAARRESLSAEGALDWDNLGEVHSGFHLASTLPTTWAPEEFAPVTASTRLGHTEATDWFDDIVPSSTEDHVLSARMRAEASLWFEGLWAPVKADSEEFSIQARNAASRSAMQFGLQATAAASVFLDQVGHLASREGIRLQGAGWGSTDAWEQGSGKTVDTYVSDGRTNTPVGVSPSEADTHDDTPEGRSDKNGGDPKSTSNRGEAPSLSEGDSPESGSNEGVDNANYGNPGDDKSTWDKGWADRMKTQSSNDQARDLDIANRNQAPCPNHKGYSYDKSTGDCSCGSNHRRWASPNNPGGQKSSSLHTTADQKVTVVPVGTALREKCSVPGCDGKVAFVVGKGNSGSSGASACRDHVGDVAGNLAKQGSKTATRSISVRDEYDNKGTLTLWSGGFASDYEGVAKPLPDGSGYRVRLEYYGGTTVKCPLRNDQNWMAVDRALEAAAQTLIAKNASKTAGEVPPQFLEQQKSEGGDSKGSSDSGSTSTCAICGDKIARDPAGEANQGWHHANGEKHDHEAKPGGKTSALTRTADLVDQIIRYEGGEMDEDETISFFQGLIDSGAVWHLQGSYGRMAQNLIDSGLCHAPVHQASAPATSGNLYEALAAEFAKDRPRGIETHASQAPAQHEANIFSHPAADPSHPDHHVWKSISNALADPGPARDPGLPDRLKTQLDKQAPGTPMHISQHVTAFDGDGTSSDQAATEAPSLAEGDTPEGGHSESPVQEPGQGAQDKSTATDSDRPDGGVNWKGSSRNAQVFVATLSRMASLDEQIGGVSGHQVAAYLLAEPGVPAHLAEVLRAGGNPFAREAGLEWACSFCGEPATQVGSYKSVRTNKTQTGVTACDQHADRLTKAKKISSLKAAVKDDTGQQCPSCRQYEVHPAKDGDYRYCRNCDWSSDGGAHESSLRTRAGKWMVRLKGNSNFARLVTADSAEEALKKADTNGDPDAYATEQKESARTAAPRRNDFSLSDAKNDEGEWIMSPEEIRAEMNYDPNEDPYDNEGGYYGSLASFAARVQANIDRVVAEWYDNGYHDDIQDRHLPYRCSLCGMQAETKDFSQIGRNCPATNFERSHKMEKVSALHTEGGLQVEAVAWGRRHYEDLASAISELPDGEREKAAKHFAGALSGTNPNYRREQFETAASTPHYKVRGGTGTAKYTRGHYQAMAEAIASYPGDKAALRKHLSDHFASSNGQFKPDRFERASA